MAPACPIFLPGGDAAPAMKATIGLRTFFAYSAAASSMPPPISPTMTMASVPASLSNACSACVVVVPSMGSPPIPMKADWPRPARVRLRQTSVPRLPLREITPTRPGANTLGTKAGMMPTKHWPGVTRPAVLGPTMRVPCLAAAACIAITSCAGMCSVSTTRSLTPASAADTAASFAIGGGMNMTATSPPTALTASAVEANTGTPT